MERIVARSERLTAYLEWLIETEIEGRAEILTPADPGRRGAQISLRITGDARAVLARLHGSGVIGDFREPDVIRLAPAPLYNRFSELWHTARALREALGEG
jgi:kynureninase